MPTLSTLGLTMTGPRPGGFGTLNDRTNEICAPGDLICAAPAFLIPTNLYGPGDKFHPSVSHVIPAADSQMCRGGGVGGRQGGCVGYRLGQP